MGRHSAADEDLAAPAEAAVNFPEVVGAGRHSHAAEPAPDEAQTVRLPPIAVGEPVPVESAPVELVEQELVPSGDAADGSADASAEVAATAQDKVHQTPAPSSSPQSGTRGDLQLLRESPRLRIRCAAAVVVPFLVYTVLLIVIDRTDVYLIWFWIPTVLAGVLIGAFLDVAHRGLRRGPAEEKAQ